MLSASLKTVIMHRDVFDWNTKVISDQLEDKFSLILHDNDFYKKPVSTIAISDLNNQGKRGSHQNSHIPTAHQCSFG